MNVKSLAAAKPFTTKDGSTIRELHHTQDQSLAEASVAAGAATLRHFHRRSEEIYFVLDGTGEMDVDGVRQPVARGDAVLIPPGAWHEIRALAPLRFLCCCAPPYADDDTFFEHRS